MNNLIVKNAAQVVTCSGFEGKRGREMSDLQVIKGGTVIVTGGIISHVLHPGEGIPVSERDYTLIDASGKALLPGFVDPHTHFVFGGYREEEFSWRMRGDSYMDIMNRGGGIVNTARATREATEEELIESGRQRLDAMMRLGITTVEGKSGYGLDRDTELKQLRVMRRLNETHPMDIIPTFMGAHAIPEEWKGKEDEFIDFNIREMFPLVAGEKLAEAVDIFCEKGVFSVEQSRRYLAAAREHGFLLKMHADEIVPMGGAELAAELRCLSADHLLQASDEGIRAMAEADVVATLLPLTAFSLREKYARGREMIDTDCMVALATDLNPGSSFTASVPLLFAIACIYMQLSPEEAVTAFTINSAAAINRADYIGSIDVGKQGDLILLQFPSYKFLPYHVGMNIVETVIKRGEIVFSMC
ncbi:imidazolonepropionase [Porphyromonadaceae bacterium NLAE-zl-C104]|jgi:imidazolonepropionase|uniref:imidazolonepropionase n=1 Tax=Proteiniphilum TaxID=294702 RepID=UPI00089D266E|nr:MULTISPECIES: imidazolonepropionase [Proteiniphilum]MDY9919753.1 imidazolonepropionase [Proteiniphilum sp.]SEA45272.1 imidazolonepropionase [Porphyromonadaceae bacterium KH3R12]SFT06758.1 imidazolonepropionase [Porphyromonadaceae bacterium NLAE-zl-C104]